MTVDLANLISTRRGQGHLQEEAFKRLAPLVRAETGCLRYDLHRVDGEEDSFLLLEQWASQAALDAHDAAPHMVAQDAANAEFRSGPVTVIRYLADPIA